MKTYSILLVFFFCLSYFPASNAYTQNEREPRKVNLATSKYSKYFNKKVVDAIENCDADKIREWYLGGRSKTPWYVKYEIKGNIVRKDFKAYSSPREVANYFIGAVANAGKARDETDNKVYVYNSPKDAIDKRDELGLIIDMRVWNGSRWESIVRQ